MVGVERVGSVGGGEHGSAAPSDFEQVLAGAAVEREAQVIALVRDEGAEEVVCESPLIFRETGLAGRQTARGRWTG